MDSGNQMDVNQIIERIIAKARAFRSKRRLEEAKRELRKALKLLDLHGSRPDLRRRVFVEYAQLQIQMKDYFGAQECIAEAFGCKVLGLDSALVDGSHCLGVVKWNNGQLDDAIDELRTAVAQREERGRSYPCNDPGTTLALVLLRVGVDMRAGTVLSTHHETPEECFRDAERVLNKMVARLFTRAAECDDSNRTDWALARAAQGLLSYHMQNNTEAIISFKQAWLYAAQCDGAIRAFVLRLYAELLHRSGYKQAAHAAARILPRSNSKVPLHISLFGEELWTI